MTWFSEVLINLPLYDSPYRVSSLDYLEPITRKAVEAILADAQAQGTPLMVFETYRSQARQELLFKQGATQLEEVGTHGFGLAADLVKDISGEPSWKGNFEFLGTLAKKYNLIWGGNWGNPNLSHSFVDANHVQRIAVRDQPKLFDTSFYPDTNYNPYKIVIA